VEEWAERGDAIGLTPTMTPEEGQARFREAYDRWLDAPHLGNRYPSFDVLGEDHEAGIRLELNRAIHLLGDVLSRRSGAPIRPWYPNQDIAPPSTTQATAQPEDVSVKSSQAPTKRKRLKPGGAALLIVAAYESLAEEKEWNASITEIIDRSGVPRSTFNHVRSNNEMVKRVVKEFEAQRLGCGPVRADEI
jgi:hypothetical protein